MSNADEYIANAEECQKMARLASDPEETRTWLEMASDWLRRAKQLQQAQSDVEDR